MADLGGGGAQKLRRCTGLNHLAHAARGVLGNEQHVQQMWQDYARIDMAGIREQVRAPPGTAVPCNLTLPGSLR